MVQLILCRTGRGASLSTAPCGPGSCSGVASQRGHVAQHAAAVLPAPARHPLLRNQPRFLQYKAWAKALFARVGTRNAAHKSAAAGRLGLVMCRGPAPHVQQRARAPTAGHNNSNNTSIIPPHTPLASPRHATARPHWQRALAHPQLTHHARVGSRSVRCPRRAPACRSQVLKPTSCSGRHVRPAAARACMRAGCGQRLPGRQGRIQK